MHLKKTLINKERTISLFGAKRFDRSMPENLLESHRAVFELNSVYQCPILNIHTFDKVYLLPDSTLFKVIVPLDISFPFFKRRLIHHNTKGILSIRFLWKRISLNRNKCYAVIHDQWTQNYYHWITQALPRLLMLQQANKSFLLLLPEDHQTEFHISSLRLMGVNSWETLTVGDIYYEIQNLSYPSHDIQIGDYNDDLIKVLSKKLTASVVKMKTKSRIWINRRNRNSRRIVNEEEVLYVVRSFEFEIIEFELLSFEEQIQLMNQANVVAGVHGAGLTNMIFMKPNSKVFELTTQMDGGQYYYYTLSNALNHKYYYQLCKTEREATIQDANLIVDIERLRINIIKILSSED